VRQARGDAGDGERVKLFDARGGAGAGERVTVFDVRAGARLCSRGSPGEWSSLELSADGEHLLLFGPQRAEWRYAWRR
jgi:hypothetical protein